MVSASPSPFITFNTGKPDRLVSSAVCANALSKPNTLKKKAPERIRLSRKLFLEVSHYFKSQFYIHLFNPNNGF